MSTGGFSQTEITTAEAKRLMNSEKWGFVLALVLVVGIAWFVLSIFA